MEQSARQAGERLAEALGCATCHAGLTVGPGLVRERAPVLDEVGGRLRPAYLFAYLRHPGATPPHAARSHTPGFGLDERESLALTLFLETLAREGAGPPTSPALERGELREQERAFDDARRRHRDLSAGTGAAVFVALNCAGCHRLRGATPALVGPPLVNVSQRLRPEWLRAYLTAPTPVRPFGFIPGTGSRMPDFRLEADDVDSLVAYLSGLPSATNAVPPFSAQSLTPFSRDKASRFIRDRFPCLGCHRLGDEGGRVGPDLSYTGERLQPAYLRYMIEVPQAAMPASAMPRYLMPSDRVTLLANYLSDSPVDGEPSRYLSLTDTPLHAPSSGNTTGADLYRRHCSACHGEEGNGDGYNAAFLPVPPTRHADSAYMATRPDDTLFDGVHAGGYILNRSHRMPAFGQLLSSEQIRSIVSYMREVCECLGPSWSRDNVRGR